MILITYANNCIKWRSNVAISNKQGIWWIIKWISSYFFQNLWLFFQHNSLICLEFPNNTQESHVWVVVVDLCSDSSLKLTRHKIWLDWLEETKKKTKKKTRKRWLFEEWHLHSVDCWHFFFITEKIHWIRLIVFYLNVLVKYHPKCHIRPRTWLDDKSGITRKATNMLLLNSRQKKMGK